MVRSPAGGLILICVALLTTWASHADPAVVIPFVEIHAEGDSFLMGDGAVGPGVVLSFSYDFSLSTYPITISQFRSFIEDGGYAMRACWTSNGWKWKGRTTSPAHWSDRRFAGQDQPVVGVSWYEAVAFCNWLSLKEGHQPPCDESGRVDLRASGYRLPTEAEWEYAAAKGAPAEAERIYPWGDVWDPAKVVCSVAPARADRPASVGSRSPLGDTPQGLADMCGNVWQWLSDCIQREEDIARGGFLDRSWFLDDSIGARMVLRGGSWCNTFANGYRAAFRGYFASPGSRTDVAGFRVVRR